MWLQVIPTSGGVHAASAAAAGAGGATLDTAMLPSIAAGMQQLQLAGQHSAVGHTRDLLNHAPDLLNHASDLLNHAPTF